MKKTSQIENRSRKLAFPGHAESAEMESLRNKILALDGVTGVKLESGEMKVDYQFPACTYLEIWNETELSPLLKTLPWWRSMAESMKAHAEFNERHHREQNPDWFKYTRDIYLHHHLEKRQKQIESHKHLWRRHQKV